MVRRGTYELLPRTLKLSKLIVRVVPLLTNLRRMKPPTNPLSSLVQLRDRRPRVLARARVHRLLRLPRQTRWVLLRAMGRRPRALNRGRAICEEGADSIL